MAAALGENPEETDPGTYQSVYNNGVRLLKAPEKIKYFGDYEIIGELARGGMGVVYLARQASLDRLVAVKLLLLGSYSSPDAVKRFHIEATAAARLQHPGIVGIFEVGEHNGQQFYSMEYVPGENLARWVVRQNPEPRLAALLLSQIADAVHFAHSLGVVHRDLKPHNVLIHTNGQPRVTDFGLAKRMDLPSELTSTGEVLGSPSYMAPEQLVGGAEKVGIGADVYGLGAILYFVLTRRAPFQASTMAATLELVQKKDPVSPRLLDPSIARDLEVICLKCLEKNPARRYADAGEFRQDLLRYLRGESISARPVSLWERSARWMRRHPARAGLVGALTLLALTLSLGGFFYGQQREQARGREKELRVASDRQRYALSLNLAEQARSDGDFERADQLLESVRPRPGDPDFRGWEWYHLQHELRGQEKRILWSSPSEVLGVASDFTGSHLALQFPEELRLISVSNGATVGRWPLVVDKSLLQTLSFLPDASGVVLGSVKGATLFKPNETPRILIPEPANTLAFSPDGEYLAFSSVDWDRSMDAPVPAGILNLKTGLITDRQSTNGGPGLVWLSDSATGTGAFWMIGSRGMLSRWRPGKAAELMWGRVHFTDCAALSPDGRHIVMDDVRGYYDWFWRPDAAMTNSRPKAPEPRQRIPWSITQPRLAFSADSQRVLMKNGADRRVALCDPMTGNILRRFSGHRGEITGLCFLGSTRRFVTSSRDGTVREWDSDLGEGNLVVRSTVNSYGVPRPIFDPTSRYLALITNGALPFVTTVIWDLLDMRPVFNFHGAVVSFSGDATKAICWRNPNSFSLFDIPNRTMRGIDGPAYTSDTGRNLFLSDGQTVILRNEKSEMYYFNTIESDGPRLIHNDTQPPMVSSAGDTFAVSAGSKVMEWIPKERKLKTLLERDALAIRYSHDDQLIAIGDIEGKVHILDRRTGENSGILSGHGAEVYSVIFTPDKKSLITAAGDRKVRFWNLIDKSPLFARTFPEDVHWLELSPDGKKLLVGWAKGFEVLIGGDNDISPYLTRLGYEWRYFKN